MILLTISTLTNVLIKNSDRAYKNPQNAILQERLSELTASHSVGCWFAHLLFECKTHVNVWVGVKRIEERVSMSQYENAQSVHLQEHLIRLLDTRRTFFHPLFFLQTPYL